MLPYNELDIEVDKNYLLTVFEKYKKDKLKQYKIKNSAGEILGIRDYYEMYFSFEEGNQLFYKIFPFKCRGYQYVYLPPKYEMVIHKDISYISYRIGCKLLGTADILFYNDTHDKIIASYNYDKAILINVQIPHCVKNNDEYRLTFFVNFTKEHEDEYKTLLYYRT